MLKDRCGAALGLALFVGLAGFGIWTEISSKHNQESKTPYRADEEAGSYVDPRTSEERIADYTLWLERFTALLALVSAVQIAFLIRADRTARISSDAAKLAVELGTKEFISTHRPKIILRDLHIQGNDVFYMLVNIGATQATVVESWIMGEFVAIGDPTRPLRSFGHGDLGDMSFAGGEIKDLTYPMPSEMGFSIRFPDTSHIIVDGKKPVDGDFYFTGAILYADDLGIRRRSVFRRRWHRHSNSFVRVDDPDQEYAD
jgi:hypothetical protein